MINALLSQTVPFALISAHATQRELRHCLKTSNANHVFVHADLLPVALSVCHDLGIPKDHIYILEGNAPHGFRSFDRMIARAKERNVPSVPIKQAKKNTLAYLLFSSGTTGLPKGIQRVTLNKWLNIYTLCSRNDLPPEHNLQHPSVLHYGRGGSPLSGCMYRITALIPLFDICLEALSSPEAPTPVVLSFLPYYHTFGLHTFCFRYVTCST